MERTFPSLFYGSMFILTPHRLLNMELLHAITQHSANLKAAHSVLRALRAATGEKGPNRWQYQPFQACLLYR